MKQATPSSTALDWQRIAGWLAAADIDCIEIGAPGMQLRMVRGAAGYRVEQENPRATAMVQTSSARAPCAGVFLQAHPLRSEALAKAGQPVAAGDVVALLRIGELLVPVTAPARGTVVGALAPQDSLVGFGTPLVQITPGDA